MELTTLQMLRPFDTSMSLTLIQDQVQVMVLEKSKYQDLDLRMTRRLNARLMEFHSMQLLKNGMKSSVQFQKQDLVQLSLEMLGLKFQLMGMTGMCFKVDFNIMSNRLLRKSIQHKDQILVRARLSFMERTSKVSP